MINAVERAFFSPREDFRRVREKLAGGMALVITVLDSLQTSRWLAMLKGVCFPAGEEMLKAKSSCHKYLKLKQAQDLCLSRAFFSGSYLECLIIGVTICVYVVVGFLIVVINISNCDSNGVKTSNIVLTILIEKGTFSKMSAQLL